MTFLKHAIAICAVAVSMITWAAAETIVRVAYDAEPVSLDPHEQISGATVQMSHMLFDPLVRWTKSHGTEPRLAERWEQIDDTTTRFHLRAGVTFHSGNKLTANDIKWTFERLRKSDDYKGIFSAFSDLIVIDDLTFDLKTNEPYPLVLHDLTNLFAMDSAFYSGTTEDGRDKAEINKKGGTFASINVSGTGPFVIAKRDVGSEIVYDRFDNYWDKSSKGNVDQVIMVPIGRDLPRVAALLSGNADVILPIPPNKLKAIEENSGSELLTITGHRNIAFQMNQDRVEAFKNPKVRLAIDYAIDNSAIVQSIMRGFGTPAGQASAKGYLGHDENLKPRYDLDRAKALMKEAGYEDGFKINMMAPNNRYVNDEKIAQAVAHMLSEINIEVELTTMPKADYWTKFDERAADMMMIGWHSDNEDSANFHQFLTACPDKDAGTGKYNSGNYCNKEADELWRQSNVEVDPEKRAILLRKLERILYEDAAFIPLHWQDHALGVRKGVHATDIAIGLHTIYFGDLVVER